MNFKLSSCVCVTSILIVTFFVLCTTSSENKLLGKFYSKNNRNLYIEFFPDGKVYYSRDGETANYSISGKSVVVSHTIFGSAKGEYSDSTITFERCTNSMNVVGQAFQGTWTKR